MYTIAFISFLQDNCNSANLNIIHQNHTTFFAFEQTWASLFRCRYTYIEAKGSTSREDIRMAMGQLFDYAFQRKEGLKQPHKAILLPAEPARDSVEWLEPLGIKIIWRRGRSFLDNANSQFT